MSRELWNGTSMVNMVTSFQSVCFYAVTLNSHVPVWCVPCSSEKISIFINSDILVVKWLFLNLDCISLLLCSWPFVSIHLLDIVRLAFN